MGRLNGKYIGYGLVRDKATGKPKVDDPSSLHPVQCGMMTREERVDLGIWPHEWARDAEGYKRVERVRELTYRAVDPLVAVSEIFDGPNCYRVEIRHDVPVGVELRIEVEQ